MTTKVYGASDDLIEVEGPAVEEEFGHMSSDPALLGFSNGVVLEVKYDDDGLWRIRPLRCHSLVTVTFADDPDDNYSDIAVMEIDPVWVVYGSEWAHS